MASNMVAEPRVYVRSCHPAGPSIFINPLLKPAGISLMWPGNPVCVKYLLDAKADTSIPEKDGYTPMHGAGFQGRAEIAKMLIAYRLNPSDKHKATWLRAAHTLNIMHVCKASDRVGFRSTQQAANGMTDSKEEPLLLEIGVLCTACC